MRTEKFAAIISIEDPTPVGFINMFDIGDEWIKIKGCDSCPIEQRIRCCGRCPCIMPNGDCYWQIPEHVKSSRKSFYCIITPLPTKMNSRCCIEYKCIKGPKKGKIRRVKDKLNVFVDEV